MGFGDWIKKAGNKIMAVVNKAQDIFCDTVDYLRYDQGFIATSLRALDDIVCTATSIPITVVEKVAKVCYYNGGKLLGFSEEQLDKPIEIISNFVDNKINNMMDYLADKGVNVRFLGDFAAVAFHVMDYTAIGKLTKGGLKKVRGIYNEGALRYRNRLIEQAKKEK